MRALFILRGAPGVGKTRLLSDLGVTDLGVGFDQMRRIFCPVMPCFEPGTETVAPAESQTLRVPPDVDALVVKATYNALEARMGAGVTVFFDATSLTISSQNELIKRAHRFGYACHLIDVQGDIGLEELRARNRARGVERLDDQSLERMWQAGTKRQFARGLEVISGSSAQIAERIGQIAAVPKVTSSRVVVVGDVHSCEAPLRQALADHDTPATHWVFVGDLFDRGPDPVGVWQIVSRLIAENRCTVVTGNHEANLRAVNNHTGSRRLVDTRETRDALLEAGVTADRQTAFVNATVPAVFLDGADETPWLVTHGGVGRTTVSTLTDTGLLHVSDAECIWGLGDRNHTYRGRSSYDVEHIELAGRQLHGHRNGILDSAPVDAVRTAEDGPVVCLESGVSTGGQLSLAVLDRSIGAAARLSHYDDQVDSARAERLSGPPRSHRESTGSASLLERMEASPNVRVRGVEGLPGIVAANFTRRAFAEGAWDEVSVHARGLFIDRETGKVVARGYEKFFHVGETPGRDRDQWVDAEVTRYPVRAVRKYNGYLALVASIRGRLMVFSKSGLTPYARVAERMLVAGVGDDGAEQLREMLERADATAVFEVLRHDDPHPITESGPDRLVLLDAIGNDERFATRDQLSTGIGRRFGLECAADHVMAVIPGPDGFDEMVRTIRAGHDEGAVLIDANGYRSKVKTDRYADRKAVRGALERFWRGDSATVKGHDALGGRLEAAGLLTAIRAGRFTTTGVDQSPHLDLAGVLDALEASRE
ncbi:hypothetical protein FEZ32_09930 [Acidipropionibacterium jensenii]|uniref:RNA ligase n=1 Tax=Acidipropionibacterium jensenii TaxID=1749 RepID=UPI00110A5021|nr:RNA ligase [Acidipropionibacterium jensenii]QCV88631.1 hypothetical protein FEZ32_09930 [Acidipropionibacterium jensenii]